MKNKTVDIKELDEEMEVFLEALENLKKQIDYDSYEKKMMEFHKSYNKSWGEKWNSCHMIK